MELSGLLQGLLGHDFNWCEQQQQTNSNAHQLTEPAFPSHEIKAVLMEMAVAVQEE